MKKTTALLAALLTTVACSHKLEEPEDRADRHIAEGDAQLAASQLTAARDSYNAALKLDPGNLHANFGSAIIDLLLLPDSKPVTDLLATCDQPAFDVEHKIFGPDGLLAQDEAIRQGSGSVTVLYRSSASGAFVDAAFTADHYRTLRTESTNDKGELPTHYLQTRLSDVQVGDSGNPGSIDFSVNVDDIYGNDNDATPLTDGTVIEVSRMAGSLYVWLDNNYWSPSGNTSGTITFHGGTQVGDSMTLELSNVTLEACRWEEVNPGEFHSVCGGQFRLSGAVSDTVSKDLALRAEDLPFGKVKEEEGPPHKEWIVSALDTCGPDFSTDLVGGKANDLAGVLAPITAKLVRASAGGVTDFNFVLPKSLLHTDNDIPLNGTDLLALRTLTQAASTLLRLVGNYRYVDGPLVTLLGQFTYWFQGEGSPASRQERGFLISPLADNLAATFLARALGFDVGPVQTVLDGALADFAAALRNHPTKPGILDFQRTHASAWSNQVADLVEAVRSSIGSPSPVAIPRNPLYAVHLKTYFDNPLDRDRILTLSGLTRLFTAKLGNPSATDAYERNDQLEMAGPKKPQDVETWSGGLVHVPADMSGTSCTTAAQCPASYTCETTCKEPALVLVEESANREAFDGDWPAFVSPNVHLMVDSWR